MSQNGSKATPKKNEENTTFSMNQVQVILKMHEETMMNFIKITIERFDTKIDDLKNDVSCIKKDVDDLKQSANFDSSTISILEEKVKKIEVNIISTPLNSESVPDGIVKKNGICSYGE